MYISPDGQEFGYVYEVIKFLGLTELEHQQPETLQPTRRSLEATANNEDVQEGEAGPRPTSKQQLKRRSQAPVWYGEERDTYERRQSVSSKYRGVSLDAGRVAAGAARCWRASIGHGGKQEYLGTYESEVAAARAYNVAAKKLKGRYADRFS